MSEKLRNRTNSASKSAENVSQDIHKSRSASKRGTKKRFELDEDMSDLTPKSRTRKSIKSTGVDNKDNLDLSKYKDEYKDLIQAVKCKDKSILPQKDVKEENVTPCKKSEPSPRSDTTKSTSSMDAFRIMMEARKKSIGMNSPGKELTEIEPKNEAQKELKAKRLLTLSMWADKKGAGKRKELEELREENIKNTLEKRADSFKKMLQTSNKEKVSKTPTEKLKEGLKDFNDIFVNKKNTKDRKKRERDSVNCVENDNVPVKKHKTQKKLSQDNSHSDSVKSKPSVKKVSEVSEQDNGFLKNLSPSIKKSESVLCYFEKTVGDVEELKSPVRNEEEEDDSNSIIKVKINSSCKKKKKKSFNKKSLFAQTEQKTPESNVKKSDSVVSETTCKKDEEASGDVVSEPVSLIDSSPKSSRRPRRNIRRPIKYSQESSEDLGSSDCDDMFDVKKLRSKKKNTDKENVLTIEVDDKVSPLKIINLQSPGQLKCVRSPRTVKPSNDKLAPLFKKCLPKPKIDPSVIEARKLFLQSGIPDVMKKHLEKSVSNQSQDGNEFYAVHHVQQKSSAESEDDLWDMPVSKYTPDVMELMQDDADINGRILGKSFLPKECQQECLVNVSELFNQLETHNLKLAVRELKQANPNFPIFKTFQQLWTKFTSSKSVKQSSQNGDCMEETNTMSDMNYIRDQVWTEKYKPASSHDIIGNFQAINEIKRWLSCWKEYNDSSTKVVKKVRLDSSSDSDFDISDSESRDSSRLPSNVMVVIGPPGSGKTSAIYAISNELGINVLELNSSSRRTGKKVIADMHEATQSHKVLTKQNSESSFSGLFSKTESANVTSKDISKKSKLSLSKRKDEKSQNEVKSTNGTDSQKSLDGNKMSLMLIDDVDVVFEEDDGFISALSQIIQSSKRPLLLVATDEKCSHLQRFKSDTNVIKFNRLSGKILGPWLDILILIECNKIIPKLSSSLLEVFNGDMRRCILQLQYWIYGLQTSNSDESTYSSIELSEKKSDEDSMSWTGSESANETDNSDNDIVLKIKKVLYSELNFSCSTESIWWNLNSLLQETGNTDLNKDGCCKSQSTVMENVYKYIDMHSDIELLNSTRHCHISWNSLFPQQRVLKDSTAESENMSMYKHHSQLSNHLCQYMQTKSSIFIKKAFGEDVNLDGINHIESLNLRAKEKTSRVYSDFAQGISLSSHLDRKSVSLDYMSTLRCISRSERTRSSSNMKRNNRFHNYLNTLNISSDESTLTNACGILYDQ